MDAVQWVRWREFVRWAKTEVMALWIASRDPRVPWSAKVVASCVVAYAFSPIDLIPDFIPLIGYLDDLILVPLGILLAVRLISPAVMAECRVRANDEGASRPVNWFAAILIVAIWIILASALIWGLMHVWR